MSKCSAVTEYDTTCICMHSKSSFINIYMCLWTCGCLQYAQAKTHTHAHMHTPRAPPSFLLVHGWMLDLDVGCWMKILVFNCMLSASWLANEADVMNACTHMHTHMRYGNFFFKSIKHSTILMLYNMMRNAW